VTSYFIDPKPRSLNAEVGIATQNRAVARRAETR
jgi:hypothetical protein